MQQLCVDEDWVGQRLDNFLLRELKGVPKTHIYRIIRSGEVRINKGRAKADTRLQAGDVLRLPPVRTAQSGQPQDESPAYAAAKNAAVSNLIRQIPIIYEDEAFIALDKPAGLAVHGGSGISLGVIETLRRARPTAKYLELVHRLDRETSGILLIAKKRSALVHLQNQFKQRETGKTYLALVRGLWPAKLKLVDQYLQRYLLSPLAGQDEGERRVRIVSSDAAGAQRAISLVHIEQSLQLPLPEQAALPASLLAVTIKTGRTHQIRVHLAGNGHAILGDDKYGDYSLNKNLARAGYKRMFLHAWRLRVVHPVSGAQMQLESALPPELQQWLDTARASLSHMT